MDETVKKLAGELYYYADCRGKALGLTPMETFSAIAILTPIMGAMIPITIGQEIQDFVEQALSDSYTPEPVVLGDPGQQEGEVLC